MVISRMLTPGRPSGVSFGGQLPLDSGFDLAPDHRGGEAGQLERGGPRPAGAARGDDDARHPHGEGFGEGVLDEDAADLHVLDVRVTAAAGSSGIPLHRVVLECHRRIRVEVAPQVGQQRVVIARPDVQPAAGGSATQLTLLHHQAPPLIT